MTFFLRSALVVSGALALSCGNSNDPEGDPFEPADRAVELAEAQCSHNTRCRPAIYQFEVSSEDDCTRIATADFRENFERVKAAIDGGRAKFIADRFDTCVDALEDGECVLAGAPECDTFFEGRQPAGEACMFSFECAPESFCTAQQPGSCGSCEPRAAANADCSNAACNPGHVCAETEAGRICVSTAAEEGSECGTGATGFCRGNLRCVGDRTGGATCQRPADMGEDCDPEEATAPLCDVDAGLACVNKKCVARNFNDVGGTCDGNANACNINGFCNGGECSSLPGDGSPCAPGSLCAPGHFCNGMQCVTAKSEGEQCLSSAECSGTLFCVEAGACGRLAWDAC